MNRDLLRVRDLSTRFFTNEGQINAVDDVNFTVRDGEVFGLVGESGSGKSVTALSVMDLVGSPGRVTDGEIWYRNPDLADRVQGDAVDGEFVNVLSLSESQRRSLRGSSFSMIFQDAMTSLNPSVTVGEQIGEAVEVQRRASANPRSTRARTEGYGLGSMLTGMLIPSQGYVSEESFDRAIELLEMVGIPDPAQRAEEYPNQFSGGMLQRAMVAQALAGEPDILIADEPTTALDVTIQAQILELLSDLQEETGMSIVVITHNLGVIARMSDRVAVMYAGEIVERGGLDDIFENSVHPYTNGLIGSIPDLDDPASRLQPIEGNVPSLVDAEMGNVCYFADRCPKAMEECLSKPPEFEIGDDTVMTTADGGENDHGGHFPGTEDETPATHGAKCYLADHEYRPENALPEDHFQTHDE